VPAFLLLILIIDLLIFDLSFLCRGIFLGPFVSKRDDCGCWKAEALETILDGLDPEAYKHCLEYCQAQGVNLDTFKFIGIGLDKLHIVPKKPELKLSRCINDVFIVPNTEAELVGKSSLELADASVTMIYKVCMFLSDFVCKFGLTSYVDLQVLLCMFLTSCIYIYI